MPTERILIVDDDPAILTLCQRILAGEGYSVVEAKRGEEALSKLETQTFDLLLTDIRLPGLNGLEVTQRLRDRRLELTVITMTGFSNMEMAIQALSLGVEEFIVKPFTLDSLRITVARALEKSRLRRENARLGALVPLLQTSQNFAAARKREQVYEHLFAAARNLFGADAFAFASLDQEGRVLTVSAVEGAVTDTLRDHVVYTAQLADSQRFLHEVTVWEREELRALPFALEHVSCVVSTPLLAHERTLGILLIGMAAPPTQSNLEALSIVTSQAAMTLENVDLLGEISLAYVNARELERLKGEFINIAGHELRTPLAVVHGYASLLREGLSGEFQQYADHVVTHAERLQRIADDMLNLKNLQDGIIELHLERCVVDQVVREVVGAYNSLAAQREQSIEMEIPAQTGHVSADRAMLDLMLGSLLSNAIKFSPRQAHVRVAAQGDEHQVTLQVRDQGKGLTTEQAEHVFEAFYQAGNSLTRTEGGLGLGLTVTRRMVNAHGGKIWVESERDGGSSFYISLPREQRA